MGAFVFVPAESSKPAATPLREATVADLRSLLDDYMSFMRTCPFERGDLITPKDGFNLRSVGEPHIVLEVRRHEPDLSSGDPCSTSHGLRFDIRIAKMNGGERMVYWVESYCYEPWTAPDAGEAAPTELPDVYDCTDPAHVKRLVLALINRNAMNFHELLDEVDATVDLVAQACTELVAEGRIQDFGGGMYACTRRDV